MSTYHIITYGCQMNEHDSENIAAMLEAMGYDHVENSDDADVVVMNTCSVREHADKRFFGALGQFKKRKKVDKEFILCVCGCMPQQPHIVEEIKKSFNWVDIIFGTQTITDFPALLRARIETGEKQFDIIKNSSVIPEQMDAKRLYDHKALVNITYGCDNFCTYCVVPYTRGREKSRRADDVLREIRELAESGTKEIMLLGQNVNSFRDSDGNDFPSLLRKVDEIDGIERIRFMTSHPKDLSDDLIDCYRTCEHLCKHIHLPVQSGNDAVLKRMNRRYDRARYLNIVDRLKGACPDIAITTDIIVGFPGETEEQFEDTLLLVREVEYDAAFTFIFSAREGTPAAGFDDQIPYRIKHERFERLSDTVNEFSLKKNKLLEGKVVKVLADSKSQKNSEAYTGRTDGFKLVNFISDRDVTGQMVDVHIRESKTFSLDGEICE